MPLHEVRSTMRRQIRRRRRPLAALLAATAVAVGLGSLDHPAGADAQPLDARVARTSLALGEVAVPVVLATAGLAQSLAVGDVIDVVGLSGAEQPAARVVAPNARVIDLPSGGGFGGSASTVVVIAVDEADALDVSAASADSALRVVIRERAPR